MATEINMDIASKIAEINKTLDVICNGLKDISGKKHSKKTLDLYKIGLIQKLNGDENLTALEKFRSDVYRIGDIIITKGSKKESLTQIYQKEFKDIQYNLVDLTEYIRNAEMENKLNPIIEGLTYNRNAVEGLERKYNEIENKVQNLQTTPDKQTATSDTEKKKNKIWQKVLFGVLLTTSVLGVTLGVKSCVKDTEQDTKIENMQTKDAEQDARLDNIEAKDKEQDKEIAENTKNISNNKKEIDKLKETKKSQTTKTETSVKDDFEIGAEKIKQKQEKEQEESIQEQAPIIQIGEGDYANQEVINNALQELLDSYPAKFKR